MINQILVPIDGSEMGERAIVYALEHHPDAEITVMHVVGEPSPMMGGAMGLAIEENIDDAVEERAHEVFDRARELAAGHDAKINTVIQVGQPTRAILNRADDFDLVVIGSHGGSLTDRLFVGNVAQKVFRRSPVPVTVVR